jgi:hypothetical protein
MNITLFPTSLLSEIATDIQQRDLIAWKYGYELIKESLGDERFSLDSCAIHAAGYFMAALPDAQANEFEANLLRWTRIGQIPDSRDILTKACHSVRNGIGIYGDDNENWQEAVLGMSLGMAMAIVAITKLHHSEAPNDFEFFAHFIERYWLRERSRIFSRNIELRYVNEASSYSISQMIDEYIAKDSIQFHDSINAYAISNSPNAPDVDRVSDPCTHAENIPAKSGLQDELGSDSIETEDDTYQDSTPEEGADSQPDASSLLAPPTATPPSATITELLDQWLAIFAGKDKSTKSCNRRAAEVMIAALDLKDSTPLNQVIFPENWSQALSIAIDRSVNTPRTRKDRAKAVKKFINFICENVEACGLESWQYSDYS